MRRLRKPWPHILASASDEVSPPSSPDQDDQLIDRLSGSLMLVATEQTSFP